MKRLIAITKYEKTSLSEALRPSWFFIRNHTIGRFNYVCFTAIDFLSEIRYTILKYTIDEKFVCGFVEVKECSTTRLRMLSVGFLQITII